MGHGVRLADPARFDVRGELHCEADVEIDVNCVFEGQVHLGEGVRIGPNCVIANARIASGAVIHAFTHIDGEKLGVTVGESALVGPFARLRPGAAIRPRSAHRQFCGSEKFHLGQRRQSQSLGLFRRCHFG
jgi:bifunctional UDP-N-acetylglucosamine pyrophosphorylase / glucosamine-1-phosphate N-acetyltransferase